MGTFKVDGDISFTGAITTPGNDTIVIKPAKNNYDQIGGADNKFWKIYATTFYGALSGNASTATKLATARTISLTGSVTGSGTFDGSGNLSIATTTNHTHSYLPLSGGTMTGAITLSSIGFYTKNNAGYYINEYGNFIHQRSETGDYFNINNSAATSMLKYYYETGHLELFGTLKFSSALTNVTSPTVVAAYIGNDSKNGLGYCTTANLSVGYASNCDTVDGYHGSSFIRKHGWWTNGNTSYHADSVEDGIAFAYTGHGVPSYWGTLCTFGYGNGRDYNLQLHGTGNNQLYFRNRSSDFGQGSWQRVQVVAGWGSTNPNSAGIRGTNTGDVYYVY